MWKTCLYCCGPYTFTCSLLLFIMVGMFQDGSWTFEVLAAKHGWDVQQKVRCCRNAAVFYLVVSLALFLASFIDAYLFNLSRLCGRSKAGGVNSIALNATPPLVGWWQRTRQSGFRRTAQAFLRSVRNVFRRSSGDVGAVVDGGTDTSAAASVSARATLAPATVAAHRRHGGPPINPIASWSWEREAPPAAVTTSLSLSRAASADVHHDADDISASAALPREKSGVCMSTMEHVSAPTSPAVVLSPPATEASPGPWPPELPPSPPQATQQQQQQQLVVMRDLWE